MCGCLRRWDAISCCHMMSILQGIMVCQCCWSVLIFLCCLQWQPSSTHLCAPTRECSTHMDLDSIYRMISLTAASAYATYVQVLAFLKPSWLCTKELGNGKLIKCCSVSMTSAHDHSSLLMHAPHEPHTAYTPKLPSHCKTLQSSAC